MLKLYTNTLGKQSVELRGGIVPLRENFTAERMTCTMIWSLKDREGLMGGDGEEEGVTAA